MLTFLSDPFVVPYLNLISTNLEVVTVGKCMIFSKRLPVNLIPQVLKYIFLLFLRMHPRKADLSV